MRIGKLSISFSRQPCCDSIHFGSFKVKYLKGSCECRIWDFFCWEITWLSDKYECYSKAMNGEIEEY